MELSYMRKQTLEVHKMCGCAYAISGENESSEGIEKVHWSYISIPSTYLVFLSFCRDIY